MDNKPKILCIACSIFKSELDDLIKKKDLNIDVSYLSSMLHMKPDILDKKLSQLLKNNQEEKNILILFGDCCPNMIYFESQRNVTRTKGINCIEIFLGREKYRSLRKEGAFFLLPEWTLRWKEVFHFELGLEGTVAKDFLQEFHTKIIYLDTGQIEIPTGPLKAISEYSGLDIEIMVADNQELVRSIDHEINSLRTKFNQELS